jgi:hypothetical protein
MSFLLHFENFCKNRFKIFRLTLQVNLKICSAFFPRNFQISLRKHIRRQSRQFEFLLIDESYALTLSEGIFSSLWNRK